MKKRLIGIILTLVIAAQVFPVDGIRFWSNLMQSSDHNTTSVFLAIEEEELEAFQFKLKNIDSNKSHFYERFIDLSLNQITYGIVVQLGNIIDRNDPILIPPPNPLV